MKHPLFCLLFFCFVLSSYRVIALLSLDWLLYIDEAYYWTWSLSPDWGYYSKPPMISWVIMLITSYCGSKESCIRISSILIYPLTTLIIYGIGIRLFDVRHGIVAALLFFTIPSIWFSSLFMSTDVLLFFFWALSFYSFIRILESNLLIWWLVLALLAGFGMLTKYTMGIFGISVLIFLIFSKRYSYFLKERKIYAGGTIFLFIIIPNIWWNCKHDFPTIRHTAQISELNTPGLKFLEVIEFIMGQLLILGPILFPILLYLFFVSFKKKYWFKDERCLLLCSFSLPFLFIIIIQSLFGRANANWAAPSYISGTILLSRWFLLKKKFRLLVIAIITNILLGLTVIHFESLIRFFNIELTSKIDVHKRLRGWDVFSRTVALIQRCYPYDYFLSNQRDILSHLAYYGHVPTERLKGWNLQNYPLYKLQFDLYVDIGKLVGKNFIFITSRKLNYQIASYFKSFKKIDEWILPISPNHNRILLVYRAINFKGFN